MQSIWTKNEIENILLQLQEKNYLFPDYEFTKTEQGLDLIGEGGFALIYGAKFKINNFGKFAIKVIGFSNKLVDSDDFNTIVAIQKELSEYEKSIVKVLDATEIYVWVDVDDNVERVETEKPDFDKMQNINMLRLQFIVMEKLSPVLYKKRMDKVEVLPHKLAMFDEQERIKLAYDIGNAIKLSHDNQVLHRDIKLENIFYDYSECCYKLGDFGIARMTEDGMASTTVFTKGYGAPEIIGKDDKKYGETADIYSFGILLFLLSNDLHFPDSNSYNVNVKTQYDCNYEVPRPKNCSDEFAAIIQKMCRFNPDDRYQNMEEVLRDIDKITLDSQTIYLKENTKSFKNFGLLLWIAGIICGTLSYDLGINTRYSILLYLLLFCGLLKSMIYVHRKDTMNINLVIFIVSIIYIAVTGMTKLKMVMCCLLYLSTGNLAGYISATLLVINVVEMIKNAANLHICVLKDYSWMVVVLMIMSYAFFSQYCLYNIDKRQSLRYYIGQLVHWWPYVIIFLMIMLIGATYGSLKASAKSAMNVYIIAILDQTDILKSGIVGLAICIFLAIRERVLEKIEEKHSRISNG